MPKRLAPTLFALAAVPVLLSGLAACSSTETAGADTTATAATAHDWAVAQAKCMRDKGHDVEDPTGDGDGQGISLGADDSLEKFTADNETCNKQITAKLGERPVSDAQKNQQADDAKTDDCLRKHGVDVSPGQALGTGDIPDDVQKACGIDASSGDSGRAR